MNNTNEKKRRTVGFKLGLAQAIIYLCFTLAVFGVGAGFEIFIAIDDAEYASSFIVHAGGDNPYGATTVDLNGDGVFENEYPLVNDGELIVESFWDGRRQTLESAYIVKTETVIGNEENGDDKEVYYDFVSEDMTKKELIFAARDTGETITVNFCQVESYEDFLDAWARSEYTHIMDMALFGIAAVMLIITVLQFVAAAKGSKSYPANNLGIVLNAILVGVGVLGLIGAVKDRKLALATDEKYIARKRAKEQSRLEREEREKAESNGSTFTGGAFANAGINMLTRFVCLITLGLAYPAMVCWKLRWKCSHTYVNGRQLTFDGNAAQFFGKFMLWLFLSVITLGIYYIVCMKVALAKWQTKHIHFADTVIEKDDENLSKFDGHWYQLLGVNWLCRFVTFITLSFGQYWAHCYKERWFCKHKKIDGLALTFDGKAAQYFGKRFCWNLLTIITLGIYAFWLAVKTEKWTCSHTHIKEDNIKENND